MILKSKLNITNEHMNLSARWDMGYKDAETVENPFLYYAILIESYVNLEIVP
jgi:hypothetical protein